MLKTTVYQVTPFLAEGYQLPDKDINNGLGWLREAVNLLYNRNKERLRQAGVVTNLLHNHDEQSGNTIARYPLVQYQRRNDEFFLAGFNQGRDTLEELFAGMSTTCEVGGNMVLKIKKVYIGEQPVAATNLLYQYTLTNWLPFNRVNYALFKRTPGLPGKVALLEQILKNHLVKDFSSSLELGIDSENTRVRIVSAGSFNRACLAIRVNRHTHDFQPFTVVFETNLLLPQHICLGNGKVYGFGLIGQYQTQITLMDTD